MLDFSHGRARRRCTFLLKFLQLKCTTGRSALVIVNLCEYYLHKKRLRRCCTFFLAAASFSSRPVSAMYWFTTFCHIHKSFGASLYNTSVLCGPCHNFTAYFLYTTIHTKSSIVRARDKTFSLLFRHLDKTAKSALGTRLLGTNFWVILSCYAYAK